MLAGLSSVQALTFDVFGTVVDWRASVIAAGRQLGTAKGIDIDWAAFADSWRDGYRPAMDRVRTGALPWTNLDGLHRMILDQLLHAYQITSLSEAEIDDFNRVWHRLEPWPDAVGGRQRLRHRFVLATLSNGNVSLLTHMAKRAGLPWDCILSAELAKHYKPDPEAYLTTAALLGLDPCRVMMVAAHPNDLEAAKSAGFRTAYIPRPLEFGTDRPTAPASGAGFDIVANDFNALADQLEC